MGIRAQFLKYRVFSKLFGRCVVGRERHSNPSALIINVIGLSLAIYEPDTNSPAHIYGHVNSLFTVSNSKLGKKPLSHLGEKSRFIKWQNKQLNILSNWESQWCLFLNWYCGSFIKMGVQSVMILTYLTHMFMGPGFKK